MDSAQRVAHIDFNSGILDFMELAPSVGICKVRPPENMLRHTIDDVSLGPQGKYGIAVLAIKRGRDYILNPSKHEQIEPGDVLLLAGKNEQISKLCGGIQELSPDHTV